MNTVRRFTDSSELDAYLSDARASPVQKRRRKVRRLSNIRVEEISLVDNPAVQEATFIITKRDAGADLRQQAAALLADLSPAEHQRLREAAFCLELSQLKADLGRAATTLRDAARRMGLQ